MKPSNFLMSFPFHGLHIRAVISDTKLFLVQSDVCRAMNLRGPKELLTHVDPDDIIVHEVTVVDEVYTFTTLNAKGVVAAVSNRKRGEEFLNWLAEVVCPSLPPDNWSSSDDLPNLYSLVESLPNEELAALSRLIEAKLQSGLRPSLLNARPIHDYLWPDEAPEKVRKVDDPPPPQAPFIFVE